MPWGMSDEEYGRFTSGEELPQDEAYRLRELKMASIMGTPPPSLPQLHPPAAPPGIDPSFHQAMVAAGAAPYEPPQAPPQATQAPPMPAPPPVAAPTAPQQPFQPPSPGAIQQLPQQAPVMSQMSPAPAMPAMANINNNVTMPQPTFNPASQRPALPQTATPGLAPNRGNYGAMPNIPGYGMPRQGQPFKPPQSLPTFAAFGGGMPGAMPPNYQPQPFAQEDLYGIAPGAGGNRDRFGLNLFNQY